MLTQKDIALKISCNKIQEQMPFTKIKAFLEEFPWVREHVKEEISQVYVSRMEPDLLAYQPANNNTGLTEAFLGIPYYQEQILLLDDNKKIVVNENETETQQKKLFLLCGGIINKKKKVYGKVLLKESVKARIEKLGVAATNVRFLLSYYKLTQTVIIYKIPRDLTLLQWFNEEIEHEREEFRQQIDF